MESIGRLDVNFLSKDYDDRALETSEPIYNLKEGLRLYEEYVKFDHCVDDHSKPPRVHLWLYGKNAETRTVRKNY